MALSTILATCLAFLTAGVAFAPGSPGKAAPDKKMPVHVTSAACAECHKREHAAWSNSHHSWALRIATQDNVLGDFNDVTYERGGIRSRFFKRHERFYIETDGPDGSLTEFEVKYTVGVEPLQQYLVETGKGRLQALDIAWDTRARRWFHLYPDQSLKADDGFHWSGPYKNWNARCAECHQTNFSKGYSPKSASYQSKWSELTIGCEACHGPGEAHVLWAKDPKAFLSRKPEGVADKGLTVSLPLEKANSEIRLCARCHSRRSPLGADTPPPGAAFAYHYKLALLRPGLYHADGQIDGEVYVYGSFLQSRMYARGVRCSDCHEPHSTALKAEGNMVCAQCHSPAGNADFETLKKADYDSASHHHHKTGSEGAKCVSCHMPAKTYMQVDPRRDHSFRVPRPDLSSRLGTTNTCTGCHDDKASAWAASTLKKWFPHGRTGTPHYGETLHAGRIRPGPESADKLIDLALDALQPAIVRATALDMLRQSLIPEHLQRMSPLLTEKNDLLRSASLQLFQAAPPRLKMRTALSMIDDPVQSVRIEAARLMIGMPLGGLPDPQRKAVQRAIAVFQSSLFARADFPETQMQIAGLAMVLRDFGMAQKALRTATAMDPQLADAWLTLARIQSALRQPDRALKTLEQAAQALPDNGQVLLQLGSLYAQQRKHPQAVSTLEKAFDLTGPTPELLDMLAVSYLGAGDLESARSYAKQLADAFPNHRPSSLVRRILKMP